MQGMPLFLEDSAAEALQAAPGVAATPRMPQPVPAIEVRGEVFITHKDLAWVSWSVGWMVGWSGGLLASWLVGLIRCVRS